MKKTTTKTTDSNLATKAARGREEDSCPAPGSASLWHRCADEKPDSDLTVLGYGTEWAEPVWPVYHNGEEWCSIEGCLLNDEEGEYAPPTHWMNFPEPPSGEAKTLNVRVSDSPAETST